MLRRFKEIISQPMNSVFISMVWGNKLIEITPCVRQSSAKNAIGFDFSFFFFNQFIGD